MKRSHWIGLFISCLISSAHAADRMIPTSVTDKYIVSETKGGFDAEGFFVDTEGKGEIFIYSQFSDDPHGIENLRRSIHARVRLKEPILVSKRSSKKVYLTTKYDLEAENTLLSEVEYKALIPKVRDRQLTRNIKLVYWKDVEVPATPSLFRCENIRTIEPIVATSGGSTYFFTLTFPEEKPLSLGLGTVTPNGLEILKEFQGRVESCRQRKGSLAVKNLTYQDPIYYVELPHPTPASSEIHNEDVETRIVVSPMHFGTRQGWVAHINDVTVQ